jgi:hypothetical protein
VGICSGNLKSVSGHQARGPRSGSSERHGLRRMRRGSRRSPWADLGISRASNPEDPSHALPERPSRGIRRVPGCELDAGLLSGSDGAGSAWHNGDRDVQVRHSPEYALMVARMPTKPPYGPGRPTGILHVAVPPDTVRSELREPPRTAGSEGGATAITACMTHEEGHSP